MINNVGNFIRTALGWVGNFNVAPSCDPVVAMQARMIAEREKAASKAERASIFRWALDSLLGRRMLFPAFGARSNPVVPGIVDIQPWLYYDRLSAAAGATPSTTLQFFTSPLSATKTKLDTNLKVAGQLSNPKHFLVMALRFVFDAGMNIKDIVKLVKGYYIELEVGDKIFAEGHLDTYPGGAGISGFSLPATAAAIPKQVSSNGIASPLAVNNWGKEHGIHILQGESFVVRAIAPTAVTLEADDANAMTPGMNVRAYLDGILYRQAQ